jgi:diguanylate cyclase (GGDEF)-like protein
MTKRLFILCFLIINTAISLSVSAFNETTLSKTTLPEVPAKKIQFNLKHDIVNLVEKSIISPNKAIILLKKITLKNPHFNYAEQYLILLVKANVKQYKQQHKNVVLLIEEAKLLTKYIADEQLKSPLFANAYLVLANSYETLNDYNNAYQNKKVFVDYYSDYSDAESERNIEKLTEKYELTHKIEENKLLANQNKLEELRINDVNKQQQELQRNFTLIICTILFFVLLFLRQLKVRKKLLVLAKTDSLTGLLNRTELFIQGNKLVKTAHEQQFELSVLLIDIDHFKLINTQLGHALGDLVLQKIALLVNETMRARDVFSRLGGEEFVAILPTTNIDQAKAIAVRVMEKIVQYNFADLGVNKSITLSIGVANLKDTNATFDDLLHVADLAMYQAKAQGTNQIVSYINHTDSVQFTSSTKLHS